MVMVLCRRLTIRLGTGLKNLSQHSEGRSKIRAQGKATHSNIKNRMALQTFENTL